MTARYAVLGNPIAHSRSPFIHQRFAEQTGQTMLYGRELIEPGQFESRVLDLVRLHGYQGFNVTMPCKLDALSFALKHHAHVSERAKLAGAVNTLKFENGLWAADNTDGPGLVRDLSKRQGLTLQGACIAIVGAGGATRGVIPSLIEAGIRKICLINRNLANAQALRDAFSVIAPGLQWQVCGLQAAPAESAPAELALALDACTVLINAATAQVQLPSEYFKRVVFAYDMAYGSQATGFMQAAQAAGVPKVCDGLGMLVEQAAVSFTVWRGTHPEVEPVYRALRASLNA